MTTSSSLENAPALFLRLIYCLNLDIAKASVVWILLAKRADAHWIEISSQDLSNLLCGTISRTTLQRSIKELVESDIIEINARLNYKSQYHINVEALERALAKPLPNTSFLPGLGSAPIPFLTRLSHPQSVAPDTLEKISS